jgi:hypothetical protein
MALGAALALAKQPRSMVVTGIRVEAACSPLPLVVQGRTEHVGEGAGWGIAKRRFPSPPNPLSHKEFKGGQNVWAKTRFEALG